MEQHPLDAQAHSPKAAGADGKKPHCSLLSMDIEAHLAAAAAARPRPARIDPDQLSSLPRLPQLSPGRGGRSPQQPLSGRVGDASPRRGNTPPGSRIQPEGLAWQPPSPPSGKDAVEGGRRAAPDPSSSTDTITPEESKGRSGLQDVGGLSLKNWGG